MSLLIMAPFNNNKKPFELVKLYPCLYNKQEKDFKKEDIKQPAWNVIAKELNISNGKEAEQYWQNLKKLLSKRRCKLKEVDISGHNLTLLSQFSVNGLATEIYRVILNYRPKLIIVTKSKSWRQFNFCHQKTIARWEASLRVAIRLKKKCKSLMYKQVLNNSGLPI